MSLLLMILLLINSSVNAHGEEIYKTIYRQQRAPIFIDGNLDDWDVAAITSCKIEYYDQNYANAYTKPKDENDLSAYFYCFADQFYLFFSVIVKDQTLIFNQARIGQDFFDDTVEICFSNIFLKSKIRKVWIGSSEKGNVKITGRTADNRSLPYLDPKLGITAALHVNQDGYQIEAAIPITALGLETIDENWLYTINIRIMDNDGAQDKKLLSWGPDFNFPVAKDAIIPVYNKISFTNLDNYDEDAADIETDIYVAKALEGEKKYNDAIAVLLPLLENTSNQTKVNEIKYMLARNYYYLNEFDIVKKYINELSNTKLEAKIEHGISMLRYSMENNSLNGLLNDEKVYKSKINN